MRCRLLLGCWRDMERQGTYEGMVEQCEEQQEHPTSLCLVLLFVLP